MSGTVCADTPGVNKRSRRLQGEIGSFVRQYGRKKNQNDPNDRRYDREVERFVKQMPPEELDELMHGDVDDDSDAEAG